MTMLASAPTLTGRILVVDDNARARQSMCDVLRHAGNDVQMCASAIEALQKLPSQEFDLILTDLQMPGMDGLQFIRALQDRKIDSQVVMVTAFASVSSAVEAMRHGALDYLEKPFDADQLEQLVQRALARGRRGAAHSAVTSSSQPWHSMMIGTSSAMQRLRSQIAVAAPTGETVLISGESGTGKELVARCVHAASGRATKALVSLNCPALSPQLMESELFGHERGAFTSADAPRVGRFELADGGTILLDEITEIELPLQAKLLRVLQEKSFERVGSSETLEVDVRVIATTNREIRQEVVAGRFRQDLFYRLAVVPLIVPALRDRREDVPLLVEHFLGAAAVRLERSPITVDRAASDLLCSYHWPGNVRELENLMTRASILATSEKLSADDLRSWLLEPEAMHSAGSGNSSGESELQAGMKLEDMERRLIEATLDHYEGHRARAAQALGIGIRTLSNKLRQYGYAPRARSFVRAA